MLQLGIELGLGGILRDNGVAEELVTISGARYSRENGPRGSEAMDRTVVGWAGMESPILATPAPPDVDNRNLQEYSWLLL